MAKRRMINKNDAESLAFRCLSVRQRYIYLMTMLYADDDGIFPYYLIDNRILFSSDNISPVVLKEDIEALAQYNFITTYPDDNGEIYIYVTHWWDKQKIRKEIYSSTQYPYPPTYYPRPDDLRKKKDLNELKGNKHNNGDITAPEHHQNRCIDKVRKGKSRTDQSILEESSFEKKEVPLPFLADGSVHPNYAN